MYLVLTALLALNVSAEIFNAFKLVNKGLEKSNIALDQSNEKMPESIKKRAAAKPEFQKYADRADPAVKIGKEFSDYVKAMLDKLIDEAGNHNGTVDDGDYVIKGDLKKLKGQKDKSVTTRNMVNAGWGKELKAKILEARASYLNLVDTADQAKMASEISIEVDDVSWTHSAKKSWEEYTFKQMPLGAVQPIFTKFINDAKSSENAILNYLSGKLGGEDVVLDKFTVISSPKKSYVIKGEPFETEISLAASTSGSSSTKVSLSVNGANLASNTEGVAVWKTTAGEVGIRKYNALASVFNPVTKETKTYKKEFEFEVGERSCSVSATKMNVFYIGVDNPVSISAAGVPSSQLKVDAAGAGISLTSLGGGSYTCKVSTQGECSIALSGGGLNNTSFKFRAKRIPTPVPALSDRKGGMMPNGTFKAQQGIIPTLEGFDFDAKCQITGFRLVRVAPRQDPEIKVQDGGRFVGDVSSLMAKAKPGDRYIFEDIKARCPGDQAARELNEMSFLIK
ncbi:MAG: GldM family protein [Saprospiraceae bacterium]